MNFKEFYNSNQKWVKSVLWLFGLSIIAGGAATFYYPDLFEQITAAFADRFGEAPPLDSNLAQEIFIQNLTASLMAWLGGLLLGFIPVIVVIVNGFILGYICFYVITNSPSILGSLVFLIAGLVPHAIFELPAFLLAAVLGLNLGLNWIAPEAKGQRWGVFKQSIRTTSKYFVAVVILLAIAAYIEVFVSGALINSV